MARLNLPPVTRGLLAATLLCTLLNFALRPNADWVEKVEKPLVGVGNGVPYLTVVPGQALFYPWVFALATVVEQNVAGLLVNGATLFYGGRYLERAWGERPYAKFLLGVAVVPNLLACALYLAGYCLTSKMSLLRTTISGGIAIQAGFLVAFKQLVPEHTVAIAKGLVRMRVKHFPAIFLLANTISAVVLGTETAMFLAYFGFFTAWVYLRFYRASPALSSSATGDGAVIKGDASDTFAFAHFFPEPLQTPLGHFADGIYNVLTSLGVCTPFSDADIDAGNDQATARAEGGLPSIMNPTSRGRGGATRAEAERRRALALKALDQRLHAAAARTAAPSVSEPANALGETTFEPERPDPIQAAS
ncbi:eukaryotic integral membrane protein-domain-containing protein [Boeremia exigua]|uniref:eukaryotic integral membrane protein-domain-containing protein n=1 Tax=Boeremia exigua TaxID=749465 RepID=UPI001E8D6844|nr:eukaryotic integral membrane protein-domain-containing protein [Boeremia exigua]KAH6618855.1 eukaryotic integral membrane protein-domain-containing protein [Boeremia exigua]